MATKYPDLDWINQGEVDGNDRRWKAKTSDFTLDCRYQWGGKWKGHWCVVVNHAAIQTGHGDHGYLFDTAEEAKAAAEAEMKARIDARVAGAIRTLETYTT